MENDSETIIQETGGTITCTSTSAIGRQGFDNLCTMQEEQVPAIKAHDKAVNTDPQNYQEYTQLAANKHRSMRIDFVVDLPYELVHRVLINLDQQSKVICLCVSRVWREALLQHSRIWIDVTIKDMPGYGFIACDILPYIADHVESVNLTAESKCIISRCLIKMSKSHFSRIRSLRLAGASTRFLNDSSLSTSLTTTLVNIGTTLTTLSLEHQENVVTVSVVDVLVTCVNLQRLIYLAQAFQLSDILGDVASLQAHHFLKDLELKTQSALPETIESLLLKCPNIRRLVFDGCSDPVSHIVTRCCPYLEIFGCNSFFTTPKWDDQQDEGQLPGLRSIYSDFGIQAIPEQNLRLLLKKNMGTLESIIGIGLGAPFEQNDESYEGLQLTNLKRLSYWSCAMDNTTEKVILRSISKCTALRRLEVLHTGLVSMAIDVLTTLPPVKILSLSHTYEDHNELADTRLIRLFEKYATVPPQSRSSLEIICLQFCKSVTDDVLFALAKLKTLYDIALCDLDNITGEGVSQFIRNLGDSVSVVRLSNLASVTDHHLDLLANVPGVTSISLQGLELITDEGITRIIDGAKNLSELVLEGCKLVTQAAATYAEKKVEEFVFNDTFDDTVLLLPDED